MRYDAAFLVGGDDQGRQDGRRRFSCSAAISSFKRAAVDPATLCLVM